MLAAIVQPTRWWQVRGRQTAAPRARGVADARRELHAHTAVVRDEAPAGIRPAAHYFVSPLQLAAQDSRNA
jgi:hypothetical protein